MADKYPSRENTCMSTGISGRSLCKYFLFSIIFKFRHHMVLLIHRNSQSKSHGDGVKCVTRGWEGKRGMKKSWLRGAGRGGSSL